MKIKFKFNEFNFVEPHEIGAVSYTHLDVYKRQVIIYTIFHGDTHSCALSVYDLLQASTENKVFQYVYCTLQLYSTYLSRQQGRCPRGGLHKLGHRSEV